MRERINRLARGIVDAELPVIIYSREKIEEVLDHAAVYQQDISLTSENHIYIKGLAYSSHPRVRILNDSFGGLRNRISYEVDASFCNNGDEIRGSFFFVTNSGEKEIPFCFKIELTESVRLISGLHTIEDYVELARKDMDLALRLMEYRDFTDAPFLQDMHVRAVYDGLKGHGNRQNALEEFFLALKAKEPVELTVNTSGRTYEDLCEIRNDKIILKKNTWGYIYIAVENDGDFIVPAKKVITQSDFEEDRYDLKFQIMPERLHPGKNFGAIRLVTVHGETVIRFTASSGKDIRKKKEEISKASIRRYLDLRLEYESGLYEDHLMIGRMKKELEVIRGANGDSLRLALFEAENALLSGRKDKTLEILSERKDAVMDERTDHEDLYCFYKYLEHMGDPSKGEPEALKALLESTAEKRPAYFPLYLLIQEFMPEYLDESGTLYDTLRTAYQKGCRSPFLYLMMGKLLSREPEMLRNIDSFEIRALYFCARKKLIGEELALKTASLAPSMRFYNRLFYRTLSMLYDRYPKKEILSAVCCILIKGNLRIPDCFHWYEKGVKEEISLTRLYEYYLYSAPDHLDRPMPRQVLLYFSYESRGLDQRSRARLYENVIRFEDPAGALYKKYEREMEQFAMEQLFDSRINSSLAVLYKKMIYPDMVDQEAARVLPAVLRSNRITCRDKAMKYVVVISEILEGEDAYPLKNGTAYVPVFFDNSVILFQDTFGNRYVDVDYEKEQVLELENLEEKCFEILPDHQMLRMRAVEEILKHKDLTAKEVSTLQTVVETQPVRARYRSRILRALLDHYKNSDPQKEEAEDRMNETFLLRIDAKELGREDRVAVIETLISRNYMEEAYRLIREYGSEGIRTKRLLKLCTRMILNQLFDEDPLLLSLAYQVFQDGQCDSVVLDYLCEHYNGTEEAMYRILAQAVKEHVETYDLEERLLAQLLFTGSDRHLDDVFDYYATRKETGETLVKAYFTVKSVNYFLKGIVPGKKVFDYLEGALNSSSDIRKVPEIYLLALSRYYSGLPSLSEEQTALIQRVMSELLENGMIFAYYRNLAPYVDLPASVLNKEIVEYHGSPSSTPVLMVRILPDEEEFHHEEMKMVYKGIYIMQKVLFEGEIMEYEIYEKENGEDVRKESGSVSLSEVPEGDRENRFSRLNSMSLCHAAKEVDSLKESMIQYITDDLTVEQLFPLR